MIPIVTMSDITYTPGVFTLLQSLEDNGNLPDNQKIILIELQPFLKSDREAFNRFLFDIEFVDIRDLGSPDDRVPPCLKSDGNIAGILWARTFMFKTLMFRLYEYPKLAWLDADMLCLNDISEINEMPVLSAAADLAENKEKKVPAFNNNTMFSTGFIIYEPSEEFYNGFIEYCAVHGRDLLAIRPSGDQTLINGYYWNTFPEKVNILPRKWGITWKIKKYFPPIYKELMKDDPKFLHLIGKKPWLFRYGKCPDPTQRESINMWWRYMERAWDKM